MPQIIMPPLLSLSLFSLSVQRRAETFLLFCSLLFVLYFFFFSRQSALFCEAHTHTYTLHANLLFVSLLNITFPFLNWMGQKRSESWFFLFTFCCVVRSLSPSLFALCHYMYSPALWAKVKALEPVPWLSFFPFITRINGKEGKCLIKALK